MWKKPETESPETIPAARPTAAPSTPSKDKSVLGPSLKINGDLSGSEDLLIQGQVEGKVDLKKNSVTVGKNGRIKADIYAETIYVEGEVQGNLFGSEKVVIRQSGSVHGNISGPRVNLEDGARFKGSIDMDGGHEQSQSVGTSRTKDHVEKQPAVAAAKTDGKDTKDQDTAKPALGFKVGSSSTKP